MKKTRLLNVSLVGAVVFGLLIPTGCADVFGTDDGGGSGGGGPVRLSDSVVDIPDSLLPNGVGGQSIAVMSIDADSEDGIQAIFDLLPGYIAIAETGRTFATQLMDDIIGDIDAITALPTGTFVPMGDDSTYVGFVVDLLAGDSNGYTHKIVLYTDYDEDAGSGSAGFSIAFRLDDEFNAEGIIRFTEQETVPEVAVDVTTQIEIAFDGISSPRTLKVRVHKPLDDLIAAAATLDADDDTGLATLQALDLGQPETFAIEVGFDGSQYTVGGYSYHPGIDLLYEKGLNDWVAMFNDGEDTPDRHTYLFRAVAAVDADGNEKGAKLALAFPPDDAGDVSTVWEDDALGRFVADFFVEAVNEEIQQAADPAGRNYMVAWITDMIPDVADYPALPGGGEDDALDYYDDSVDDWERFSTWVTDINTALFVDRTTAAEAETYFDALSTRVDSEETSGLFQDDIAFVASFVDESGVEFPADTDSGVFFDDTNYDALRSLVLDNDDSLVNLVSAGYSAVDSFYSSATGDSKHGFLLAVIIPSILDRVDAHGYSITRDELRTFLNSNVDDGNIAEFKAEFATAERIVNPAFYHPDDGFFATLNDEANGGAGALYILDGNVLVEAENLTPISELGLDVLDLATAPALVPATEAVYFSAWTVE